MGKGDDGRVSREDTLGGFSGVEGRKSRREEQQERAGRRGASRNERSSQYVVTGRPTLPRARARRVDNRFREDAAATGPGITAFVDDV